MCTLLMNLNSMKDRIEQMPKNYQIEIARLLIHTHNIAYDENQNGLFINMAQINEEVQNVHETIYRICGFTRATAECGRNRKGWT